MCMAAGSLLTFAKPVIDRTVAQVRVEEAQPHRSGGIDTAQLRQAVLGDLPAQIKPLVGFRQLLGLRLKLLGLYFQLLGLLLESLVRLAQRTSARLRSVISRPYRLTYPCPIIGAMMNENVLPAQSISSSCVNPAFKAAADALRSLSGSACSSSHQ